jgi:predicted alpha/beta-hydrolase family hydrolase
MPPRSVPKKPAEHENEKQKTPTLTIGPKDAAVTFLFAHGAGAPMDSAFMTCIAKGVAARGVRVVRFEFPYMAARRRGKGGGAPDRAPVLLASFHEIVSVERARAKSGARLVIGGKSMGGRIASMMSDEAKVDALVCLGYPFWPPGKARDDARIVHLRSLATRALIVQGTRDPFGGRDEIESLRIRPAVHFLEDGDHDFKPRKSSGRTHAQNLAEAIDVIASFVKGG